MSVAQEEKMKVLTDIFLDCNSIPAGFFQQMFRNAERCIEKGVDVSFEIYFDSDVEDSTVNPSQSRMNGSYVYKQMHPDKRPMASYRFTRMGKSQADPWVPPVKVESVMLERVPRLEKIIVRKENEKPFFNNGIFPDSMAEKLAETFISILDKYAKASVRC